MSIASTLTQRTAVRVDKQIVAIGLAAALGWFACEARYNVNWLIYRNDALTQVQRTVSPDAPKSSTASVVQKARSLKQEVNFAKQVGCIDQDDPAAK